MTAEDTDSAVDYQYLRGAFDHFAEMCAAQSPLYAEISRRVAGTDALLELTAGHTKRQPVVNLFFGAVHRLLLAGVEHPLASFYRSVGGREPPEQAFEHLLDFCRLHEASIRTDIVRRRVQTNEVGRSGLLLPALAMAAAHADRPLHLIEIGCSAGLHLQLDRFHYTYVDDDGAAIHRCGEESAARIRTAIRPTDTPPRLPSHLPEISGRTGVDVSPVDLADDDAIQWIESLIWPDQVERLELFRAAVAIARQTPTPPTIVTGDGIACLPDAIAAVPAGALPCIFHSHAIYQMKREWRDRFSATIGELARDRPLAHVSLEWLGDDPGPQLWLTCHDRGGAAPMHLADCHHHGAWMRWLHAAT